MIFFTFISKALSSNIENDMRIAETQIFNENIFIPIVTMIWEITNEHEKKTYWDLNEIQINRLAQQCFTNYKTPMINCVQANMLKLLYFVSVGCFSVIWRQPVIKL